MKRILLLIMVALLPIIANAYDAKIDGIYYYFTENDAEVTYGDNYNSYSGKVIIPASVTYLGETYTVTCIGNNAFADCSNMTSIKVPSTLKRIQTGAFKNCTSLSKIIVTDIASWCSIVYDGNSGGDFPMYYAKHLYSDDNTEITEVVVPEGVTRIESLAFRDAKYITSITIPKSVTYIGREAFRGTHSLTSIVFPQDITSIEPYTCQDCEALTSVDIPEGVTNIGNNAFAKCYDLKDFYCYAENAPTTGSNVFKSSSIASATLHVPTGFVNNYKSTSPWSGFGTIVPLKEEIEYNVYIDGIYYNFSGKNAQVTHDGSWQNSYSGAVVIPKSVTYKSKSYSVTSIGEYAFAKCTDLTSIAIPESVTIISRNAFYGCSCLTSVTIPQGVKRIESYAFKDCSGLISVTIPESVTTVSEETFSGCRSINDFYCHADIIPDTHSNTFKNSPITSATLHVPSVSVGLYKTTSPWSGFGSVVSLEGEIEYDAYIDGIYYNFSGNNAEVTKGDINYSGAVVIPESVTYMGTTYTVTSIGNYAFYRCTELNSITIGSRVLSMESNSFTKTSLKKVIWLTNTPPSGYQYINSIVNYVANNQYSGLTNVIVYPFLSSLFEVGGIKYVPVSPSERTCDAIDCAYNESVENINIGESVTNKGISLTVKQINPYLCYGNTFVKDVNLGFTGDIGTFAFYGCSGMNTATISNQGNIGDDAFSNCANLSEVTIRNQGDIGYQAFYGCSNLSRAIISNHGSVGEKAFYNCTSLNEASINNQGSIGDEAFSDCSALQAVEIGQEILSVGSKAFRGCSMLESIVIPNSVDSVGNNAFESCSAMTSVKIGTGVSTIPAYAFSNCSSLQDIQIGNGITLIDTFAFQDCSSISTIHIPQNVTSIADNVFNGCISLKTVLMDDGDTELKIGSKDNNPIFSDCPLDSVYIGRNITYPTVRGNDYSSPFYYNKKLRSVIINDQETEITPYEFFCCSALQTIQFGIGIKSIGKSAFGHCTKLESIVIPDSVTYIGESTFFNCPALTSVNIGSGVKTIPQYAFGICSSLTDIKIGTGVTLIDTYAFSSCSSLTTIRIPQNVTTIANIVFSGCTSLQTILMDDGEMELKLGYNGNNPLFSDCPLDSVYIGRNITYPTDSDKGYSPFYNNTKLRSVFITNKETEITPSEFSGCYALQNVEIGQHVSSIGGSAFSGCSKLESILIPDSVVSIGENAFENCSAMKLAKIGTGVKTIPSYAFCGCSSLKDMQISNSVSLISPYAFSDCSSMPAITIPSSVISIGNNAFKGCTSLKDVIIEGKANNQTK